MGETKDNNASVDIGWAVLFGTFVGFVVGASWGVEHIGGNFSAWPAWLQAIGPLVAVAVAIYVPAKQRKDAREDAENSRSLRARSLVIAIAPPISLLRLHIVAVETRLDATNDENERLSDPDISFGDLVEGNSQILQRLLIAKPPIFKQVLHRLYLLGATGEIIQTLIASIDEYNGRVESGRLLTYETLSERIRFISSLLASADSAIAAELAKIANSPTN